MLNARDIRQPVNMSQRRSRRQCATTIIDTVFVAGTCGPSACLTMLERAIVEAILSVCLSVCESFYKKVEIYVHAYKTCHFATLF